MRRARPSSWIAGASFLPAAGDSGSSSSSSSGPAAAEQNSADAAAAAAMEPSPRERELRAALGSDEVLPNNVTLLMSRRQRGEDEGEEEEDDEGLELEDVVLDDEEAGPGSAGGDAAAAGMGTGAEQQGAAEHGAGTIAPLIHQVLRMPLMWRPPSPSQPQQQEQEGEDGQREQQEQPPQQGEEQGGRTDDHPMTPAAPTLGPAALALLLSAFLVRARREQQLQHRDRRRVHRSLSSSSASSASSSSSSGAASSGAEGGEGSREVTDAGTSSHGDGGGVLGRVRAGLRACWAPVSGVMRRNHLVVLYCFGAFVLVRMWFFAFARKDSKLISFCAFIMFLAGYIWWTRRVRAARLHAAQVAAAAAARQLGARRGGLFEGMDLRELQNIMMEARLHEDQRERGLSAEGKAALVHFSYKKPPPSPTAAPIAQAEAAAGGGGFEGEGAGEEGGSMEEEGLALAPTVSRQSSSCLSLAASTKQPSGVWTEEQAEGGAGGCCGLSEGAAGKEGGSVEEEDEEMGLRKEWPSSPGYPADALIDRQCSICLSEYEEGDSLTLLPVCRHTFHDACLSVWLARHVRCPLCQFDLSVLGSGHSGPSPASLAATPMAPRRRGGRQPAYEEDDSDEDDEDEEEEEEEKDEEQGRGGGGNNRRVMMTIVNEPAGRVGFGGERGSTQHPVMRIVAVDVGEEGL